jgi:dTDP-4-amino-4,6-dideoxygalactose transaminase
VVADVDPRTLLLDPSGAAAACTERTAAVVVTHLYGRAADVAALRAALPAGIAIVEDCAQAHGARWCGRAAGSLGRLGCFSMQNGKVLSAGEGGAIVTDDDTYVQTLEELRADSRSYRTDTSVAGELDLAETAGTMGVNFCMSELTAAVLCAQLRDLDRQHEIRNRNYDLLAELLADVPGVRLLQPRREQDRMSIYELPLIFDPLPGGMSVAEIGRALTAELGVRFYPTDDPLHRSRLLRPWTKPSLAPLTKTFVEYHRGRSFPKSDHLAAHCVVTHHSTLLAEEEDMLDVAGAVAKVASAPQGRRPVGTLLSKG